MNKTIVFLGAGFSKASGLKTTSEVANDFPNIGPTSATEEEELQNEISKQLSQFWRYAFGWNEHRNVPSLEDHFTLIDLAANSGHNIGTYTPKKLRALRRLSIHRVFDILDQNFEINQVASQLLNRMCLGNDNTIITTNWDTAVERYITDRSHNYWYGIPAHSVQAGRAPSEGIPILKLHGSSNWMYCDSCRRIYIGPPGGGKTALHLGTFLQEEDFKALNSDNSILNKLKYPNPFLCSHCNTELSARVATFSYRKALGFFQFQAVWDKALEALREAKIWLFIGYSLPQADFEIRSLLKTAQMADLGVDKREIFALVGKNRGTENNYKNFFGSKVKTFRSYLNEWWKRSGDRLTNHWR